MGNYKMWKDLSKKEKKRILYGFYVKDWEVEVYDEYGEYGDKALTFGWEDEYYYRLVKP